jgi:hypothetical protein
MFEILGITSQALFGQLLIGLINGAFYAMLSLGLAVIFGMLNIINFTHGALYMIGAFVAWMLLNYLGIGYWWALVLSPIATGTLGVLIERFMLSRLRDRAEAAGATDPDALADDLEGLWIFKLNRLQIGRGLLCGLRGQRPIGRRTSAFAMMNDARLGFAFLRRHVPALRRRRNEHLATRRPDPPKRIVIGRGGIAAARMLATEGRLIEGRLLDPHVLPGDIQLLGDDHGQHGAHALANLRILGQDRDDPVRRYADIGGDGGAALGRRFRQIRENRIEGEPSAQGDAGFQESAAGQVCAGDGGFCSLAHHDYFASATCLIPARMRV